MNTHNLCQYCYSSFNHDTRRRTAEHIISKSVISLYPEQDITFLKGKKFIDNIGPTISDVCDHCNNTLLSSLDAYGKNLVQSQFHEPIDIGQMDEVLNKQLDYYPLSRWILKTLYNHRRAVGKETAWFKKALGYMLHDIRIENCDFSLFAGLHVNTNPIPEEAFTYMPLQINETPKLFRESLLLIGYDIPVHPIVTIPQYVQTYGIRFGTAVFYCILWAPETPSSEKQAILSFIEDEFSFSILKSSSSAYGLRRVSAHSNSVMGYGHLVSSSGLMQDDYLLQEILGGSTAAEVQRLVAADWSPDFLKRGKSLVELAEFPGNKKVLNRYKSLLTTSTDKQ